MYESQNIYLSEGKGINRIKELAIKNYGFFIISIFIALTFAFIINRYSSPIYKISASIMIREDATRPGNSNVNDFLNSNLFGVNQNFQNEYWVIKSSPVIEMVISNLDLVIFYYSKGKFKYFEKYNEIPFRISYLSDHPQPINIKFEVSFLNKDSIQIKAEAKKVYFLNFATGKTTHEKDNWKFNKTIKFGELIETPDLSFALEENFDLEKFENSGSYAFEFKSSGTVEHDFKSKLEFNVVDRMATVIEIAFKSENPQKGIDLVNEIMNVYSKINLDRKNHIAIITIDYIESQLNQIADSLSQAEDNLQYFRSSHQLLNMTDQASGISAQYIDLQNQLAELITQKRYYDYVSDYLVNNENLSNMILPSSIGIPDPLLNNLMSELITAHAQRSNLIENNQERNPMVQRLSIQIENMKNTISENIAAIGKTTNLAIEEMNKRIRKTEAEISRIPQTQRRLGTFERKYRLNDAIYSYLLEKHAEAKITKASNRPDNIIIEPAHLVGNGPISPNKRKNYIVALFLGTFIPLGFLMLKKALSNKIESQDDITNLSKTPLLGKISHNKFKKSDVMFEFPKSTIAESFRTLRTNLEFYRRNGQDKVIMVTSCLENEGKSFIALNLSLSFAQLGRKTILLDFDLRKLKSYFNMDEEHKEGISTFIMSKNNTIDMINKSPYENLDYIPSGVLPPNPIELLSLNRTGTLIETLRNKYDIIVLDTAPLGQVSDAYLLINHSDIKLVVARQDTTPKKVFSLIMRDLEIKNTEKVYIVLNDNRMALEQYGYGYGYKNNKSRIFGKKK